MLAPVGFDRAKRRQGKVMRNRMKKKTTKKKRRKKRKESTMRNPSRAK